MRFPGRRLARLLIIGMCGAGALSAVAYGDDSSSGRSSSAQPAATTSATKCGSYRLVSGGDPDGIIAALPKDQRAKFDGFPYPVRKSPWHNWKPRKKARYKVGIEWSGTVSDYQATTTRKMRSLLEASPLVGKSNVIFQSVANNTDAAGQLAQFNSLILKKPDIILLQPIQSDIYIKAIARAAKAGIPVLTVNQYVNARSAVTLAVNYVGATAPVMSRLVGLMGGKGNLLKVRTVPGVDTDNQVDKAVTAVLKNCPNIKTVGQVYGFFANPAAKGEVLKFLAGQPDRIAGVAQYSGMGAGVIQAFESTGRPVPPIGDVGSVNGSLGWWLQHKSTYKGVAINGGGPGATASTVIEVALRMLKGKGVKSSAILGGSPLITTSNLSDWGKASSPLTDFRVPDGPPGAFITSKQLDSYFTKKGK